MLKVNSRGVSAVEFVVLIGIISLALSAMSVFLKRGVQSKVRDIVNNSISRGMDRDGRQFVTDRQNSTSSSRQDSVVILNVEGGSVSRNSEDYIYQNSNSEEKEPLNYWGGGGDSGTINSTKGASSKQNYPKHKDKDGHQKWTQ